MSYFLWITRTRGRAQPKSVSAPFSSEKSVGVQRSPREELKNQLITSHSTNNPSKAIHHQGKSKITLGRIHFFYYNSPLPKRLTKEGKGILGVRNFRGREL